MPAAYTALLAPTATNRISRRAQRPRYTLLASGLALPITLLVGIITCTALAGSDDWLDWQVSSLGNTATGYSVLFNSTLVGSGLLCLAIAVRLDRALRTLVQRGTLRSPGATRTFTGAVAVGGGCLIGVGLVPIHTNLAAHNTFGITLLLMPVVLMATSLWSLAGLGPSQKRLTTVSVATLTVSILLFRPGGLYTLAVEELIAGIIIFAWFNLTLARIDRQLAEPD